MEQLGSAIYSRKAPVEEAFRDLARLEGILGVRWLDERLRQFEARREEWRKRPYTMWSKPEPHPLVPGLWDLREWRRRGHSQKHRRLPGELLLVAEHARYISMVFRSLRKSVQGHVADYLGRRLRNGNVGPILFEVRMSASMLLHGHQTEWLSPIKEDFHDIEIRAEPGGVAVECKCQGLGAGRKVPVAVFRRLAGEVDRIDERATFEYGIVIEPYNRLEPSDVPALVEFLDGLFRENREARQELCLKGGTHFVTVRKLCPKGMRVPAARAKQILAETTPQGPGGLHLAVKSEAHLLDDGPVEREANPGFLLCQSRERDHVVGDLMELAKHAADRLPTDKPGIVVVHLSEHVDWASLKEGPDPPAIDYAVTKTFSSESKRHVSLISFSSEDRDHPFGPRYTGSLPSYTYENPQARFPLPLSFLLKATPLHRR